MKRRDMRNDTQQKSSDHASTPRPPGHLRSIGDTATVSSNHSCSLFTAIIYGVYFKFDLVATLTRREILSTGQQKTITKPDVVSHLFRFHYLFISKKPI